MSSRRIGSAPPEIDPAALERGRNEPTADIRGTPDGFAILLDRAAREQQPAERSGFLREALLDFVMPRISDPAILRGDRPIAILEDLLSDILPQLDDRDGARSLAVKVVRDEMARQRSLLTRIQQGIAA